ncbi:MAG: cytochrome bc1 complex diheme cytochrome c subunit [Actinomycetes bacterium]
MNSLLARRRHPITAGLVLLVALLATGGLYALLSSSTNAVAAAGPSSLQVEQGRQLYQAGCATCHGLNLQGTSSGPSLIGVGAAAVDFQVGTGRMPLADVGPQAPQKYRRFDPAQTAAIAAYVASMAPGPAIPTAAELAYQNGNAALGGNLYRTNCAMCHNFAGQGGALTNGKYAPALRNVTPRHMYEAMLTGPESMPVFGDSTLSPQDKRDIIKYIMTLNAQPNPGGISLGRIGPISEGMVAWIVGIGALIGAAVWLGTKSS